MASVATSNYQRVHSNCHFFYHYIYIYIHLCFFVICFHEYSFCSSELTFLNYRKSSSSIEKPQPRRFPRGPRLAGRLAGRFRRDSVKGPCFRTLQNGWFEKLVIYIQLFLNGICVYIYIVSLFMGYSVQFDIFCNHRDIIGI